MSETVYNEIDAPTRILMGPGPSNVHPRVQMAMMAPMVGHLDPYFISVMEDTVELLRTVFRTKNELTFPISGTGSAGMEAGFINFLEPGDVAVIGVNGFFSARMVENAVRCGARVVEVPAEWGSIVDPTDIEAALKAEKKVKMVAVVHAETSTGVLQPLEEISKLAKEYDALFLADTVTSLGGAELAIDDWGIDISYSGSQKCLGCPPGLAPFTVNKKALDVVTKRSTKVPSWYLDLSLLSTYWTNDRFYHHTAPISMVYAFYESLRLVLEEGMEERIKRHQMHGDALKSGLEAMGLELHAQEGHRLSMLTTVRIPSGVDDATVRKSLLNGFNLEIGGGLGPLKGLVWRIGLMGYSSTPENVLLALAGLEKMLANQGHKVEPGAGVKAATEYLKNH